jgi:beta-lactamase class A
VIPYTEADLLEYAPVTRAHVAEKGMTVDALCAAAMEMSDNTAANLLYPIVKGPDGLTKFVRKLGDGVTRMDRTEPTLNRPYGQADTTTPRSMAGLMRTLLAGAVLSAGSRSKLEDWMVASQPGRGRLRAGLPALWRVGAKSGTGNTEANDVAIAYPIDRPPVFVAAYLESQAAGSPQADNVLKEVGRIVGVWA